MAPAKPVELPPDLRAAMTSIFAGARLDAVSELGRWLQSEHAGRRMAAENALRKLAQDDSRQVATAASTALHATLEVTAPPAEPADQPPGADLEATLPEQ